MVVPEARMVAAEPEEWLTRTMAKANDGARGTNSGGRAAKNG